MTQFYLVTGLWLGDYLRFADGCYADSPEEAEAKILEQYTGEDSDNPGGDLVIAGTLTLSPGGEMMVVA